MSTSLCTNIPLHLTHIPTVPPFTKQPLPSFSYPPPLPTHTTLPHTHPFTNIIHTSHSHLPAYVTYTNHPTLTSSHPTPHYTLPFLPHHSSSLPPPPHHLPTSVSVLTSLPTPPTRLNSYLPSPPLPPPTSPSHFYLSPTPLHITPPPHPHLSYMLLGERTCFAYTFFDIINIRLASLIFASLLLVDKKAHYRLSPNWLLWAIIEYPPLNHE